MPSFLRRALAVAEDIVYVGVGIVLLAASVAVLFASGHALLEGLTSEEGTKHAVELTLDSLLLAFILVELLGAVRTTLSEKTLVAEPFLLVGIIASIKEIVVLGAFERGDRPVEDVALEAGALAGVVLLLSFSAYLVRRKEREPDEASEEEDVGPADAEVTPR